MQDYHIQIRSFRILFILIVTLTFCQKREPPITIGLDVWPGYGALLIAQEKGFFEKNGVSVHLVLDSYSSVGDLYKNNSLDGLAHVYADALYLNTKAIPATVVYVFDASFTADSIVGQPSFTSIEELKGKTIGVESINSFSHLWVLMLLEKNGIAEGDVFFEVIPVEQVLTALDEKKIDAGHLWEPYKSKALKKGYVVLGTPEETPGIITDVLFFTPEIIQERPDDIQAIIESIIEAQEFIASDPDAAAAILAPFYDLSAEEIEDITKAWDGIYFLSPEENKIVMMKPQDVKLYTLYESGRMILDFYSNRGQLNTYPDIQKIIYPVFVETAAEE